MSLRKGLLPPPPPQAMLFKNAKPTGAPAVIPELIHSFEATVGFLEKSVADLSEEEMVTQPPGVPNHAAWTLGHIIFSCQGMASEFGTDPWLPEDWEADFGYGSIPRAKDHGYPGKADLIELLSDSAARLAQTVRGLDSSALARELPDTDFPTMGDVLLQVVAAHTAYHAGQLAVWRRALGKESVEVFV